MGEFFTEKWHYTIIDAPGHRDFIKNMITGASQADVALIMVPADGNFTTAIAKGNHKAGEIQGQTRQHSRLINLLGVKQLIVGVNKMDCDTAGYKKDRYDEISAEMINMLQKVGWKKDFVLKSTPILPISGWVGDNLLKKSENMKWWNGCDIEVEAKGGVEKLHIDCLYDCLNNMARPPVRPADSAMRSPVSGIYQIKGVGDVVAGRVEQGTVKPGEEVCFLPTHTASNPCGGKVFTVEMHHKRQDSAGPGDNIGMNKGSRQAEHAAVGRRDGVQEGHVAWCVRQLRCPDPGSRHPGRDQDRLLPDWLRPLRSFGVPHREDELEDRQGDGRQEDGGPALAQVERDGRGELRPAAAAGRRHVQELRGSLPHRFLGRQRRCHAWEDREEGGQGRGREEEVSAQHNATRAQEFA